MDWLEFFASIIGSRKTFHRSQGRFHRRCPGAGYVRLTTQKSAFGIVKPRRF
jgi:hypothetical protein